MDETTKLAIERYRVLMAYHASERNIFVRRMSLFLTANAVLFGFASQALPTIGADEPEWAKCFGVLSIAGVGLATCHFWGRARTAGDWHINNVLRALLRVEEEALGEDNGVFRRAKPDLCADLGLSSFESTPEVQKRPKSADTWSYLLHVTTGSWFIPIAWSLFALVAGFLSSPYPYTRDANVCPAPERLAIVTLFIAWLVTAHQVSELAKQPRVAAAEQPENDGTA